MKAPFCVCCCRHHFVDAGCDPTDLRYTSNARALDAADAIEELAAISRERPRPIYQRGLSYAEETAWNDPWWT